MYDVLYLDLDGALLNDDQLIARGLLDGLRHCADVVQIVLGTRRHRFEVLPYIDVLDLGLPVLCCDGAYMYDFHHKRIIQEYSISPSLVSYFAELTHTHRLAMTTCSVNSIEFYHDSSDTYLQALRDWVALHPLGYDPHFVRTHRTQPRLESHQTVFKLGAHVQHGPRAALIHFASHPFVQSSFRCCFKSSTCYEFVHPSADRLSLLKWYLGRLGMEMANVCAVGVGPTDVGILKEAGYSIAMSHGAYVTQLEADDICANEESRSMLTNQLTHLLSF